MATQQEFNREQLTAARKALWRQSGEQLATLEAAQEFVERFGLVAFAPSRLGLAAPSLVEATLGEAKEAPSAAEMKTAREFVGRLMGEGAAIPLNLLGGGGDAPDFVVSTAAFPFIFTLRGDKNWKKAPATSGAVKVSPLALRVYETLTERGSLTAAELANELGREVTEAAITRALNELWQMLRVLPIYAQGDGPTLWELTSRKFSKAIKAGANAGLPTALSALVSLYLAQALSATEDEIETFLSPLTARSRVREVVRALTTARELTEVVVEGKALLHVSGELPEFAPAEVTEPEVAPAETEAVAVAPKIPVRFSETETPEPGKADRIRRFGGNREGGRPERKPRAFDRSEPKKFDRGEPKTFERRERKPFADRERGDAAGDGRKKDYGAKRFAGPRKTEGGWKPAQRGGRQVAEDRPFRDRPARAERGERQGRPFGEKKFSQDRGPRRQFERREAGEGFAEQRSDRRPPRKEFAGKRPPRAEGAEQKRSFDQKRPWSGAKQPWKSGPRKEGDFAAKPRREFEDRPKREFGSEETRGERPQGGRPKFGGKPQRFGERKPFAGARGGAGGERPRGRSFGAKPEGRGPKSFGGGGSKPRGAKFAGGKPTGKKFGARPSGGQRFGARKPGPRKPKQDFEE